MVPHPLPGSLCYGHPGTQFAALAMSDGGDRCCFACDTAFGWRIDLVRTLLVARARETESLFDLEDSRGHLEHIFG